MRLTRDEILLITFVLIALLAGAVIKRHRDAARALAPATHSPAPGPSTNSGE
jgi:hypothetical protein